MQNWLNVWSGCRDWDNLIIVVDGEQPMDLRIPPAMDVQQLCWPDHERMLGKDAWIISRKDSACRCLGLLAAWHEGAEYVASCDDDCYPDSAGWFTTHMLQLTQTPRWVSTADGIRPRGLPYRDTGRLKVAASMGLWRGTPDIDGPNGLCSPASDYHPQQGTMIWPRNVFAPFSGMNFCVTREALPLFYFPLMGSGQPYARFDDIWAGCLAKHCCDALGWSIVSGPPFVRHIRASDPIQNLVKEAPGIAENERFWRFVDEVDVDGRHGAVEAMLSVGMALRTKAGYYGKLGQAIMTWCELFEPGIAA